MVNPIQVDQLKPSQPAGSVGVPGAVARPPPGQGGFADELRRQLEQVSRMQAEAEEGIEHLLTGQTDNLTEVLTAARKAEVAFSLLMEIRNKLVDAYTELKQLRV